jgi:hypothetical protein
MRDQGAQSRRLRESGPEFFDEAALRAELERSSRAAFPGLFSAEGANDEQPSTTEEDVPCIATTATGFS